VQVEAYYIDKVPNDVVTKYLSAEDMELVTIANFPSKKYCSPTKFGEYLCNGLPYIVTQGTSEDDSYASQYDVGVVVESFHKKDVIGKIDQIEKLISEDKAKLCARYRQTGIEYIGSDKAVKYITEILSEINNSQTDSYCDSLPSLFNRLGISEQFYVINKCLMYYIYRFL